MYPSNKSKSLWLLLSVIALIWTIYSAGLRGGYFFDDFQNVAENSALTHQAVNQHFWRAVFSSDSSALHRPVSMITFAIQAKLDLLTPFWSKFINVFLHSINIVLIFALTLMLTRFLRSSPATDDSKYLITTEGLALTIAALWAVAPIQISAVLYVVQRMESLAALFTLAGLVLYSIGRIKLITADRRGWWFVLAGVFVFTPLAVLAKETGVLLPAYAFLIELFIFRFNSNRKQDKNLFFLLYALVLFIPGVLGAWFTIGNALSPQGYVGRDFNIQSRLLTELRVMVDYIKWIILPTPYDFSFYHDDIKLSTSLFSPITTFFSFLFISGALIVGWVMRRKYPLFTLGVFFFFAGQSLVSTFIPLELVYEHRNYLPSFGLFLALIGLLTQVQPDAAKLQRAKRLAGLGLFLVLAIYTAQTAFISYQWRSSFTQAKFLAIANPESTRAIFSFARDIQAYSNGYGSPSFEQAVSLYKKIYDRPDASINAVQALIVINAKEGNPIPKAYWDVLESKMQGTISAEDNSTFRLLSACVGNGACKFNPDDLGHLTGIMVRAYNTHSGNIYLAQTFADYAFSILGQEENGIEILKNAVALHPESRAILADLTAKLWQMGNHAEADHYYQQLVKVDRFQVYAGPLKKLMGLTK